MARVFEVVLSVTVGLVAISLHGCGDEPVGACPQTCGEYDQKRGAINATFTSAPICMQETATTGGLTKCRQTLNVEGDGEATGKCTEGWILCTQTITSETKPAQRATKTADAKLTKETDLKAAEETGTAFFAGGLPKSVAGPLTNISMVLVTVGLFTLAALGVVSLIRRRQGVSEDAQLMDEWSTEYPQEEGLSQ